MEEKWSIFILFKGGKKMKGNKRFFGFILIFSFSLLLAACGNSSDSGNEESESDDGGSDDNFTAAMVTDTGGVDDKSFNQSSWEGLQEWGEENDLKEGSDGYDYSQSEDDSDYLPNLSRLAKNDFNIIFGVGFLLEDAVEEVAEQNPDTYFSIIDTVAEGDNVTSITFGEHEGSFLAGVAAAEKTETDKIGFLGGVESDLITKFEAGYIAGAKAVNPDIEIDVQYAGDFNAVDKGKVIASNMFNSDIDVVYHSAGNTGNGAFAEAKDIKKSNPDEDVWVIGVDRDQYDEGTYGDDDESVTFTSMVKRVDIAVQDVIKMAEDDEYPGGEVLEFGLDEDGISIADTNEEAYTEDIQEEVEEWEDKIRDEEIEVPKTDDELESFEEDL